MRDKLLLTQRLVALLPAQHSITQHEARVSWWINFRRSGGLRLTDAGYIALAQHLKIEHYSYTIPDSVQFQQKIILKLDRHLKSPYHVHVVKRMPNSIRFFGRKEAMLAILYRDLDRFLDLYS